MRRCRTSRATPDAAPTGHQVVVWLLTGDRSALSPTAVDALSAEGNHIAVSAVSIWEIAIKRSLGKLRLPDRWAASLTRLDFAPMPITAMHAERVEQLPWHHRDPSIASSSHRPR